MSKTIWTVGHSNRTIGEFLHLLAEHEIACTIDVRRFPGSRKHPHSAADALRESLEQANLQYLHSPGLGGRRGRPKPDSPNTGWRVESFQAYADYMATDEFEPSLDEAIQTATSVRSALMCAEAVPWRCHRRLISDALTIRGWRVWDILAPGQVRPHALTQFAREEDGRLIYPGALLF